MPKRAIERMYKNKSTLMNFLLAPVYRDGAHSLAAERIWTGQSHTDIIKLSNVNDAH